MAATRGGDEIEAHETPDAHTRHVRLTDVAELAGVSVSTASRVISGNRPVRPDIAARVRAAAAELRYQPNLVAKSLRLQQSGSIGVVVPRISNPFFPLLVEALAHSLGRSGIQLFLCDSRDDDDQQQSRLEALMARQVDAIVLVPSTTSHVDMLDDLAAKLPLVIVDRAVEGLRAAFVSVDNDCGIRLAVEHLQRCGVDSITLVSADPSIWSARVRQKAFDREVSKLGVASRVIQVEGLGVTDGEDAADIILAEGLTSAREAVLCANDLLAIGLSRRLRLGGVRTPDDLLLVGFDDIPFARLSDPSITTIRQPVRRLAENVVELLGTGSGQPDTIRSTERQILPRLIVRESTRRASDDDLIRPPG